MTINETPGHLDIILSPEEYTLFMAANIFNHPKQSEGAKLKQQIQEIVMVRLYTYGTYNITLSIDWSN